MGRGTLCPVERAGGQEQRCLSGLPPKPGVPLTYSVPKLTSLLVLGVASHPQDNRANSAPLLWLFWAAL